MGKDISEYYWYDDADDRLEGMFGKTRTVEHGHNFDMVQFEERASELMRLEEIYARTPDLRKGSRRLSGPLFDHVNPVSIGKQAVSLQGVSLPGCWMAGAQDVATMLSRDAVFAAHEYNWLAMCTLLER